MMRRVLGVLVAAGLLAGSASSVVWAKKCNVDDPAVMAAWAAAKEACPCDKDPSTGAPWASHGKYVKCVKNFVKALVKKGQLPKKCKGKAKKCAAKSTCGKPGFVTCCRTNKKGKTKCSIKKSAEKCRAPKKGSACVGNFSSCCEACKPGGCASASPSGAFLAGLAPSLF